jgi:Cu2+-exporting ATPase
MNRSRSAALSADVLHKLKASDAHVAANCFHCSEPIPQGVQLTARHQNIDRPVCCIGCQAAAQWIEGLGLADYYRLRSEPAQRSEATLDFSAWDRPELARLHVRHVSDERSEVAVLVEGLRCSACAWLIERALGNAPGVAEVGVNAAAVRMGALFGLVSPAVRAIAPLKTLLITK